ncbi:MAG: prepilin peptidase, partial [Patescibacteria group bacterium]
MIYLSRPFLYTSLMLWLIVAIVVGIFSAALVTAGVFRVHDEWEWMRPKKACIRCELPRTGLDFIPIVGDIVTGARCRKCNTFIPWQYPVIELTIIALVVFHFWRYTNGVWISDTALGTDVLWLWIARDVVFSIFLLIVFVYDMKFSLILDNYSMPAAVVALVLNFLLGFDIWSMIAGMAVLFCFFFIQYALSGG